MRAAVVVDSWKLPIFERHLQQSSYTYTIAEIVDGALKDTTLLTIETENVQALYSVLKDAHKECTDLGSSKPKKDLQ